MRNKFQEQLEKLNIELISMGILCEKAISKSATALEKGLEVEDENISDLSLQIETKERTIEEMCIKLLMQQQPVAKDLRMISAAIKMVTDMKRIGIQAVNIYELVDGNNIKSSTQPMSYETVQIVKMAKETMKMVTASIDAFVKADMEIAREVIAKDDLIDNYFTAVKNKIVESLVEDSSAGERAIDMLMVAKYLERIADHAENIARWVIFSIDGKVSS